MANEINLKVHLQPDIANLSNITQELDSAVTKAGDKKLTEKLTTIKQKLASIQQIFNSQSFGKESFKGLSKEIEKVFGEIQSAAVDLGKLDMTKGFKEFEAEAENALQKVNELQKSINKTRKGMIQGKEGKMVFSENEKNKRVQAAGLSRTTKVKGKSSGPIQSYEAAVNYQAALKKEGKIDTKAYRDVSKLIQEINAEEAKRQVTLQKQNDQLVKEKQHYDKLVTQAKAAVDITNNTTKNAQQQKATDIYTKASQGKMNVVDNRQAGIAAANNNMPKQPEMGSNINNDANKASGAFGKAVKNLTSYTLILGTMKRAMRSALQTIKVLDKSLTEQAMVAGKTKKEMQGLLVSYQNIASANGATTKEVAEVATEYFRQGKSAKEALTLTEAAVAAAKVGAISTADSVDYLTTAINGFGMAAEDAMKVSDRFAALAASSATNYEELAVALSKVASQANLAGMSMDFTLGLLAKGIETTREAPETIGTALKTIIARMREMTDYGKTLDGESNVNNLERQLEYVGIALRDSNGELRSTQAVLDEVGRSWNTFNANQQAALAKAMAGTRQQSRFISMMQNYDRTLELVSISQKSIGATAMQMSTYMTSLEAATNEVSVAWEKFITSITNTEIIINTLQNVAAVFDRITDFASSDFGQFALLAGAVTIITTIVGLKTRSFMLQREMLRMQVEQQKRDAIATKVKVQQNTLDTINGKIEAANLKIQRAQEKSAEAERLQKEAALNPKNMALKQKADKASADAEAAAVDAKEAKVELEQLEQEQMQAQASLQAATLQATKEINGEYARSHGLLGGMSGLWMGIIGIVGIFKGLLLASFTISGWICGLKNKEIRLERKANREKKKGVLLAKLKAAFGIADNVTKSIPIGGWAIALTILAAMGAAVGVGIAAATGAFEDPDKKKEKAIKKETQNIVDLSAEVMKLHKSITAIDNALHTFEDLDKHIIKTKEDTEALNKALDAAAETLTEEERAEFNSLTDPTSKRSYLERKKIEKQESMAVVRNSQIGMVHSSEYKNELLKDAKVQALYFDTVTESIWRQVESLVGLIHASKDVQQATGNIATDIAKETTPEEIDAALAKSMKSAVEQVSEKEFQEYFHQFWSSRAGSIHMHDAVYEKAYQLFKNWNITELKQLRGWKEWDTFVDGLQQKFNVNFATTAGQDALTKDWLLEINSAKPITTVKGDERTAQEVLYDPDANFEDTLRGYESLGKALSPENMKKYNQANPELASWYQLVGDDAQLRKVISDQDITANGINEFSIDVADAIGDEFKLPDEETIKARVYANHAEDEKIDEDSAEFKLEVNKEIEKEKNAQAQQFVIDFLRDLNDQTLRDAAIQELGTDASEGEIQENLVRRSIAKNLGLDYNNLTSTDKEKINKLAPAYSRLVTNTHGTALTSSQNANKIQNEVTEIYQKQNDYLQGKLKGTEFSTFVEKNPWFFDQDGAYDAFVTGQDLSEFISRGQEPKRQAAIKNLDAQIASAKLNGQVGLAKVLEADKKKLEDVNTLYSESLELRLKKEETVVNRLKKMKEKERDEEIKVLEEKKKAYQEYFESIDKIESAESYEEQRANLLSNMNKLGAGTDAATHKMRVELENELKELEDNRLKELKEEARNKLIEDIDHSIEDINRKFDELLSSDRDLIATLGSDEAKGQFFGASIADILSSTKLTDNQKISEFQQLIHDMRPYMSPNIDWDKLTMEKTRDGNVILKFGEQIIDMGSKQEWPDLWASISKALTELGIPGLSNKN